MTKHLLWTMTFVLFSLVSGCTTERHYPAPPPTVIHEERPSAADARSEARQGAREGAHEGIHDTVR